MRYVATLAGGIVAQVEVHPDSYNPGEAEALIGPENIVGIGWAYDGEDFDPPYIEEDQDAV